MAVVLRLQRYGKKVQPSYKVVAIEKTKGPTGKPVEVIGSYNPKAEKVKDKIKVNLDRYDYWIRIGAKPSPTLESLIKKLKENKD
ncbi:MAG: 30S ribosomal protein S16 [Elusimicrobiales bacterium]|nr:30S ribosomal protein S16 [Elusimicrobiales bacterium]